LTRIDERVNIYEQACLWPQHLGNGDKSTVSLIKADNGCTLANIYEIEKRIERPFTQNKNLYKTLILKICMLIIVNASC
jgi:hypothetical protein